jgi:hypothetical protein
LEHDKREFLKTRIETRLRKEIREFIGKTEPLKETQNNEVKPAKVISSTSDRFLSGWTLFQWKRTKTERNKICVTKMKLMILM